MPVWVSIPHQLRTSPKYVPLDRVRVLPRRRRGGGGGAAAEEAEGEAAATGAREALLEGGEGEEEAELERLPGLVHAGGQQDQGGRARHPLRRGRKEAQGEVAEGGWVRRWFVSEVRQQVLTTQTITANFGCLYKIIFPLSA